LKPIQFQIDISQTNPVPGQLDCTEKMGSVICSHDVYYKSGEKRGQEGTKLKKEEIARETELV
jgi:hypothetical protein